jgi:hypothetical protein
MTEEQKPFEGLADKVAREQREREEAKAKRKTLEEQMAEMAGVPVQHDTKGNQHYQIAEPVGVIYGETIDGKSYAQCGPYKATKHNRQRALGKHNEANDAQRDNSDWLFDT